MATLVTPPDKPTEKVEKKTPPVTDEKLCDPPVPRPSEVRNATRRSLALEVEMAPDVMLVEGED